MVGHGAGRGGDTVIDMPADQQEKKSLVRFTKTAIKSHLTEYCESKLQLYRRDFVI